VAPDQSSPNHAHNSFKAETLDDALHLVQKGFESNEGTGRSEICECSHDWKTTPEKIWKCGEAMEGLFRLGVATLSEPFLSHATELPKVSGSKSISVPHETISCQIEAKIRPDPFVLEKFKILTKLKRCRELRQAQVLELSELLIKFSHHHVRLIEIRHLLRTEKYPTRGERKEILDKAIVLESEMSRMDSRLLELGSQICDNGRKEIKYFTKIIPVRKESFLFLLMDARRDPLQVSSDIDKELSADWTNEEGVYKDHWASESSFSSPSSSSSSTSGDQEIDPKVHIPTWPRHYIDHLISIRFLPHIEAIKVTAPAPKRKHYAKFAPMSGQYQYSSKKKGKLVSSSAPPTAAPVVKEKSFRDIPGLRKFHTSLASDTLTYHLATETRQWSADLSRWFQRVEELWRHDKQQLCLSFIQRARHLLNSALRYSVVKATDVRLAKILQRANFVDLFFLLLCRGGVMMQVDRREPSPFIPPSSHSSQPSRTGESVVEESSFPSPVCDALFGKHPFSIWVYFYLLRQVAPFPSFPLLHCSSLASRRSCSSQSPPSTALKTSILPLVSSCEITCSLAYIS
jgi:hypothetical protein